MTIRLRCAECRRKLKVPDAARGRRVQCPVCGARFRESGSPSAPPPAEIEAIDALFADATSSSFSIPEEPAAPEEITIPTSPPAPPAPASPAIPDLELEEPPVEVEAAEFGSLEPEEVDTDEPTLVEEALAGEMVEITDEVEELDAVEVVDDDTSQENAPASFADLEETEVIEAVESEEKEEKPSKKKKKKGFFSSLFGRKKARDADD